MLAAVEANEVDTALNMRGTETTMPATIMPISMAYSAAVGPSSLVKKSRARLNILLID